MDLLARATGRRTHRQSSQAAPPLSATAGSRVKHWAFGLPPVMLSRKQPVCVGTHGPFYVHSLEEDTMWDKAFIVGLDICGSLDEVLLPDKLPSSIDNTLPFVLALGLLLCKSQWQMQWFEPFAGMGVPSFRSIL